MRGIGIEEAAAIGAEHLDRHLRGNRPDRDGLLGAFQRGGVDIGAERLRHALPDREEMLTWMKPIAGGLQKVFLVHGEPDQQLAFRAAIRERYGLEVIIPERGRSFELGLSSSSACSG